MRSPTGTLRRPPGTGARRPAVFLDKDGTLVEDVPHNVDPALLRFTPQAGEGLRRLQARGYALVVVSNQPGLATGRFTLAAWQRLERALRRRLREEDVELEGVYACPHAPAATRPDDGADDPACACRKPQPGLLKLAAFVHHLDLGRSWMCGDILDDVEAGRRAGCRTVFMDVGHETVWRRSPWREPDVRCTTLLEAATCIESLEVSR